MIGIGVDTGGTYTDAVIYDFDTEKVLGKGKSPTTHQKLEIGIEGALDQLPADLLEQGEFLALSTTLATNACVEGTGGRAKLIFFGVDPKILHDRYQDFGLPNPKDIILLNGEDPSWEDTLRKQIPELKNYDGIAIVQIFPQKDGGKYEQQAKHLLEKQLDIPCICGYDLFQERNVLRRGAGALLNAQLIPVICNFIKEVKNVLKRKNLNVPIVIVRSDGSMMSLEFAQEHPVETLLCGPAASVMAGAKLAQENDALIIDMGGTTTDIAVVEDGSPVLEKEGICIGNWKTLVKGLYVDTFGLGGDTAVRYDNNGLYLDTKRVVPLCALAAKYPEIVGELRVMLANDKLPSTHFQHEFFLLVRDIQDKAGYTKEEQMFCAALKNGPLILNKAAAAIGQDTYSFKMDRLEAQGIVIRCGLTPTDIMHIRGDFDAYDATASRLAVEYVSKCAALTSETLGERVYQLVYERLYCNLVRILWNREMPEATRYEDSGKWDAAIHESFKMALSGKSRICSLAFKTKAALVGIGAPIHIFLEPVAKLLGTKAIIPDVAPEANALGAVLGHVTATYQVEITTDHSSSDEECFEITGVETRFHTFEEACAAAEELVKAKAAELIRKRGANKYTLSVSTETTAPTINNDEMFLWTTISAKAVGIPSFFKD